MEDNQSKEQHTTSLTGCLLFAVPLIQSKKRLIHKTPQVQADPWQMAKIGLFIKHCGSTETYNMEQLFVYP